MIMLFESVKKIANLSSPSSDYDSCHKYLPPPLDKSMFLSPVTDSEVMNIIMLMKRGSSEGLDVS
jgi:hypothetical protein